MPATREKFYRIVVGDVGIYEAVFRDCPKDDPRRAHKPDGGWLPRVGEDYPGAISFWSEFGLRKYHDSGLLDWHVSVVRGVVEVVMVTRPMAVVYEDEYQIICMPDALKEVGRISINDFRNQILST